MKKLELIGWMKAENVSFVLTRIGDKVEEIDIQNCKIINKIVQEQETQQFALKVSRLYKSTSLQLSISVELVI